MCTKLKGQNYFTEQDPSWLLDPRGSAGSVFGSIQSVQYAFIYLCCKSLATMLLIVAPLTLKHAERYIS